MPSISANTLITLPARQLLIFSSGGTGVAQVSGITGGPVSYVVGLYESYVGPYDRETSVYVTGSVWPITYTIDTDGVLPTLNDLAVRLTAVEASGGGGGVADDAVTNAKLANVATATIKGRATSGTGDPEDLTATQVRTLLNVANGATANANTDALTEGSTNQYFTAARVRSAVLTGLTTVAAAAIAATDTVMGALQKLQAQINDKISASAATTISATKAFLAAADKFIIFDSAATDTPKTVRLDKLNNSLARLAPVTSLGTTGTVNLDLAALAGFEAQITATGNITFTTSNRAAGQYGRLRIAAGGSTRTLTWPSWTAFGAALPTSLASGKVLRVAWDCTGTTDASVDVAVVESV